MYHKPFALTTACLALTALTNAAVAAAPATASVNAPMPTASAVGEQLADSSPSVGAIVISEVARRLITDYYQQRYDQWVAIDSGQHGKKNKQKHMPPGLAKKGGLPPGIQQKLARGGTLPPGLAYRNLPPDLLQQLPPLQAGYRYVIIDDRVMLIRAATNLIMDALQVAAASF